MTNLDSKNARSQRKTHRGFMRNIIDHDGDFNPQAFIDEMNKTGYDETVLAPWIEAAKKR